MSGAEIYCAVIRYQVILVEDALSNAGVPLTSTIPVEMRSSGPVNVRGVSLVETASTLLPTLCNLFSSITVPLP